MPYIVSTLAPLVHKQWWRLRVGWLDPRREEPPLVGLIPKVLVQVGISDLLQWLHVVHWNKMTVEVHELNATLQTKRSGGGGEREEEPAKVGDYQTKPGEEAKTFYSIVQCCLVVLSVGILCLTSLKARCVSK